ncbi:MAG: hypothetical protein LUG16_07695, partial [Candidatus Gastranaerophilales bacterium]|nr:hypothetical protein [Candidatus Gastranaerophilales bacterium]
IFKTVEIFLSAPASLNHKRKIKIMHVETNIFARNLPVDINFDEDIELTVYNNRKVYNLLSSVIYKKRLKDENKKSKIHNKRAVNIGMPES